MTRTRRGRPAITLIEMMVTMALTLVIMLILTESFKMSLDFVRGANVTGVQMYQLNGAGAILTRDLKAEHFLRDDTRPRGGVRLSDQRSDNAGWTAPKRGFFRVEAPPAAVAATDGEGFDLRTATTHRLHFTVILPGGNDSNQGITNAGAATYRSRVYEVAYFLVPTGSTTPGGGPPLHDRIRRDRRAAPTGEGAPLAPGAAADPAGEVISRRTDAYNPADDDDDDDGNPATNPGPGSVNTLGSLRRAANRMPLTRFPGGNARYGEDILISNVLSFEIQTDWSSFGPPANRTAAQVFPTNTDYPFQGLPPNAPVNGVYDTASTGPQSIRIKQLQFTIRVYDPRLKQSRQNTWKVAM